MARRYAEDTKVPAEQSEMQIRKLLMKAGAGQFVSGITEDRILLGCTINDRQLRFVVRLPEKGCKGYDQEIKRLWRALLLAIKAKLESAASGIETFEEAFLANIVMPDGKTISDHTRPAIQSAYTSGDMPPLLPDYTNR